MAERPELKNGPIAVAGDPEDRAGIVAAAFFCSAFLFGTSVICS